jgi:predicted amidophosphoribosyltransferase
MEAGYLCPRLVREHKMNNSLLKSCKACGKEVSRYSPFCRNCGHPQGSSFIIWLLVLFLILVLASYTAFMIYCACHPESFQT